MWLTSLPDFGKEHINLQLVTSFHYLHYVQWGLNFKCKNGNKKNTVKLVKERTDAYCQTSDCLLVQMWKRNKTKLSRSTYTQEMVVSQAFQKDTECVIHGSLKSVLLIRNSVYIGKVQVSWNCQLALHFYVSCQLIFKWKWD